jgi:hypothetical protein
LNEGGSDDELHGILNALTSKFDSDLDHEMTSHAPQPNPNKRPWTHPGPDPEFDWDHWMNLEDSPPPGLAPPKRPKLFDHENQVEHASVQQPNPGPSNPGPSNPGPSADPHFDWNYWTNLVNLPPLRVVPLRVVPSPKEPGLAHENQVEHVQQPSRPGPSSDLDSGWMSLDDLAPGGPPRLAASPEEFGQAHEYQAGHVQPSNPGPSTEPKDEGVPPGSPPLPDPERGLDHQSSSEDSQPVDPQAAATYAAKGKAKQLRRVSGTMRGVGNAAQRELQLAERSLDPRE